MSDGEVTQAEFVARIRVGREAWRDLVRDVGPGRMEEPGALGEWSFRDLAGHLLGWRNRGIARFEAAGRGEPDPPPPWPAQLDDDAGVDLVNDWIREQDRERSTEDLVAAYDASFERLAAAIESLPQRLFEDPGALPWLEGAALRDIDPLGHFSEEHESEVRAWLAGASPDE